MPDHASATLAKSLAEHMVATLQASAAKTDDDSAAGALARGLVFQLAGYNAEAADSFGQALSQDPATDEAAARLSRLRITEGRFAEALAAATTLASRNPTFEYKEASSDQVVSAMTLVGDALSAVGRTHEAIEAYKVARESNPKDTFAAGHLAQLYIATGEPRLAAEQATAVSGNTRYAGLAKALARGAERALFLLPSIQRDSIGSLRRVDAVGRPVIVAGEVQVAPLVRGDDAWCLHAKGVS